MADASFATVVRHLLVWSSDARALAGDTRGVLACGLQNCGQAVVASLLAMPGSFYGFPEMHHPECSLLSD